MGILKIFRTSKYKDRTLHGYKRIKRGKGISGKFYESEVFSNLPANEVEEYNKRFPKLKKLRFPGQWD